MDASSMYGRVFDLFGDCFLKMKKLPAGFDLTTHNSAGEDETTRPRRQGFRNGFFRVPPIVTVEV
jgi:hypothetical protein